MKITLTNNFHNTAVSVYVTPLFSTDGHGTGQFYCSKSQVKRINKALCGMSSCGCGVTRGEGYDLYTFPDGDGYLANWVNEYNSEMANSH
jgi:hypothetical protein